MQPKAFDPSPNALTPAEVQAIEDRLQAGQAPRTKLIRKMLRVAVQSSNAYQAGVAWASGKLSRADLLASVGAPSEAELPPQYATDELYLGGFCKKCGRPTGRKDDVDACGECW